MRIFGLRVMLAVQAIQAAVLLCAFPAFSRPLESFSESLLIRRLDESKVGLRFEFVFRKLFDSDEGASEQYESFPKIIGQVVTKNVTDLRLVMTRGTWRWGSETLWPSIETGAPGVEVWARLKDEERDWIPLVRALAGMTCASLDGLQQRSAHGNMDDGTVFATMPSETVCTENISPWLKLLPCRSRVGFGSFITVKTVVDSSYYSLALTTRRSNTGIELIQSLSVVLPLRDTLGKTLEISENQSLLSGTCSLAHKSLLVMETSRQSSFSIAPSSVFDSYQVWKLPFVEGHDISGLKTLSIFSSQKKLRTVKWRSGWGDLRGTFSTALYNDDDKEDLIVRHLEIIPSFLRPKLDTLRVVVGNASMSKEELRRTAKIKSTLLRGPPATIEFTLTLPKGGKRVLLSYSFNKDFLFFDEFPPNPNRGFDVPSAVTSYNRSLSSAHQASKEPGILVRTRVGPVRRASEALLVSLPQPDFSMPYNVITLSSTGFALFFGMIVNVSVRRRGDRWVSREKSFVTRLKTKAMDWFGKKTKSE